MSVLRVVVMAMVTGCLASCTHTVDENAVAVDPLLQDTVTTRFGDLGVAVMFVVACSNQVGLARDDPEAEGILIVADLLQNGFSLADIRIALHRYHSQDMQHSNGFESARFVKLLAQYKVDESDGVCRLARQLAHQNVGPGAFLVRR